MAGYLHDVGKITIPSEILSKPGKLNAAEFKLIQEHAQASLRHSSLADSGYRADHIARRSGSREAMLAE